MHIWLLIESWIRDTRHGFRLVAKRVGFSATVILSLGIGIGATTTIFSLIDAVLLRPLPYPDSDRLISLRESRLSGDRLESKVAPARLEDWQRETRTFQALAGCDVETFAETTGVVPEQVHVASVSPRFFTVLGTAPAEGRVFSAQEDHFGGAKAVIISDSLRQRRFGNASPLGRALRLEGKSYVIVGVMPRSVEYPSPSIDAWIATQADRELMEDRGASARFYDAIGRLRPGVTLEQAQADLDRIQRTLGQTYPKTDAGWGVALEPLKEQLVGKVRPTLWMLFGSVSLLLVIACANVGCLLLAQLNGRVEELATRYALGSGRVAIARQLLAEGQAYALLGGGLGIWIAYAGVNGVRLQLPDLPRISEATVDVEGLAFAAGLSFAAAVAFTLVPMLRVVRRDLAASVVRAGRGIIGGSQYLSKLLVAAQLAFATVLLVGAGLFLRSLLTLQDTPLGFSPDHVLALRISASYSEPPDAVVERHQRTMETLAALPGARAVAMSRGLPGAISVLPVEFRFTNEAVDVGGTHFARRRVVTAGYFQAMGISLLAGETCRMNRDPREEFEAIVNKAFVDRYGSGRDPIGRRIMLGPQETTASIKIVGVAGNAREEGYAQPIEPVVYSCGFLRWLPDSEFLIRTAGSPASLAQAAREAIHGIEPGRAVYSVQPLAEALSGTLSQQKFRTLLVGAFSVIALTLAAIGLYGVLTYMVSQRSQEFGIRLAFGASPQAIALEILRSAGVVAAAGGAAGLALAAMASRIIGALISGVRPTDPMTYLASAAVLLGVVVVACLSPGWKAMSVDPIETLRR